MNITVADYISSFLKSKKIHEVFMLTGYGAMYLNDAIKKNGIKYWPTEDNIFNDYKIFKSLELETIIYISKPLWVQTTDGGDNISFKTLNKDIRFK